MFSRYNESVMGKREGCARPEKILYHEREGDREKGQHEPRTEMERKDNIGLGSERASKLLKYIPRLYYQYIHHYEGHY